MKKKSIRKRIIILCDGTWNDLEMRYITNVGRLAQILEPVGQSGNQSIPQVLYYDDGVGAHDSGMDRVVKGIIGRDLERNIYEAYRFLVFNYVKGDQVCLFGFSRGAYTVRSLAGMIERIGLVSRTEMKHIPGAMEAYRGGKKQQQAFVELTKSKPIDIALLGCWDTVGSMGIPDKVPWLPFDKMVKRRYEFLNTNLGVHVKHALHAVAIDERRKEFMPTLMHLRDSANAGQTLKQVWFPGTHGCVGGGTWEYRGLSNRCLKWMLDESNALGITLGVDMKRLRDDAMEDPSIFYVNDVKFPYGDAPRSLKAAFEDLDHTAVRRYMELPEIRKGPLKRLIQPKMNQLTLEDLRTVRDTEQHLEPGESAWARVFSRKKSNDSKILVRKGERYVLTIGRTQVWKDGNFDPCDVLGWRIQESYPDGTKQPWENGEPADTNFVASRLIKAGRKNRLVSDADWFELVMSLDGRKFSSLGLKRPPRDSDEFVVRKRMPKDGRLFFAANDLDHGFVDKFGNNRGWVWVRIERTA